MRTGLVIAVASALAACHPTAPSEPRPAAPPIDAAGVDAASLDHDLPRLAERALALYEAVASGFVGVGVDCAAATKLLGDLAATYADVIAANAKVLADHRAGELRRALDVQKDRFDAAAKSIMESTTLRTCSPDKAFERAFDRLMAP